MLPETNIIIYFWALHNLPLKWPLNIEIAIEYSEYACLHWAHSVSSFSDFLFRFQIFLLFDTFKPLFFQMFLLRSIKAYLCPNTINFGRVDFTECRSEEVITLFLMLSVHTLIINGHANGKKKVFIFL